MPLAISTFKTEKIMEMNVLIMNLMKQFMK